MEGDVPPEHPAGRKPDWLRKSGQFAIRSRMFQRSSRKNSNQANTMLSR